MIPRVAKAVGWRARVKQAGASQHDFEAVLESGIFDPGFYLKTNPDVASAGVNPLTHYLAYGRFEKRKASATFDPDAYLEANPEVAASGIEPFLHYVLIGRAANAPRSRVEVICREMGLDYETVAEAEGLLSPEDFEAVLWSGVFDAGFYLKTNPDVASAGVNPLTHYLAYGRFEKRKASATFDPDAYLEANPEVAASGIEPFLHYVLIGRAANAPRSRAEVICRERGLDYETAAETTGLSQHDFEAVLESGIFDPGFYLKTNPDVASAGVNPLTHYLAYGRFEKRKASATFDPDAYLEANPGVAAAGMEPFLHYVLIGRAANAPRSRIDIFCRKVGVDFDRIDELERSGLSLRWLAAAAEAEDFFERRTEIEVSGLFDIEFYRRRIHSVDKGMDSIAHYMIWGYRSYVDPGPNFSSGEYCVLNSDIDKAGVNPLLHYINTGRREQRVLRLSERDKKFSRNYPFPIDAKPSDHVALECMAGAAYLCRYGFTLEKTSSLKHAARAINDLARRTPGFQIDTEAPDVSIIIPVYEGLQLLLNCLDSLVTQTSKYRVEIIVADNASPLESRVHKIAAVPWIRYLRNDYDKGFLQSCNDAAADARGRYLVFLNNDTRLVRDWLDELIGSFKLFPKAALVGSKLINGDQTLQEAGGILWRDGTAWNFGRGDHAWRPEYCFSRAVDYCSGASIAVSAEAWKEVGGFDPIYRPAYCEDTDLAFQLRRAGYETWLQPLSLVVHYEGMTHGRDVHSGIKAYQVSNLEKFYERWSDALSAHGTPGQHPIAESNRTRRQRVLIIDAQTPTPDRDSGSNNTYEVMRLFLHLGWHVTFVPRNFTFMGEYTNQLQRIGVEMLINPAFSNLGDILQNRPDFYDIIFAFRVETLWDWYEGLRTGYPRTRIVFHDVDLNYLRIQRKAELLSDSSLQIEAEILQDRELELFASADCSVVVTEAEKTIIESQLPLNNIIVYPYTIDVRRSQRPYDERRHLCFVGGYGHDPNIDAVIYFVREIWPQVKPRLQPDAKFFIVGPNAPDKVQKLASEDVIVTGHVPQLDDLLDDCRILVAPLRYGAGIKGKLVRSLASGLPSVGSSIAVEGMGLIDEQHVLVADDPETFAEAIVRLYYDRDLWHEIQEAGYAFVEHHYSWKRGLEICSSIIRMAEETWIARRRIARQKRLTEILDQ
jgi:GT2 family glycosyltransferase